MWRERSPPKKSNCMISFVWIKFQKGQTNLREKEIRRGFFLGGGWDFLGRGLRGLSEVITVFCSSMGVELYRCTRLSELIPGTQDLCVSLCVNLITHTQKNNCNKYWPLVHDMMLTYWPKWVLMSAPHFLKFCVILNYSGFPILC